MYCKINLQHICANLQLQAEISIKGKLLAKFQHKFGQKMRICTLIVVCAVVACYLFIDGSDAVACTSLNPDTPTGCTDCSDPNLATDPDCVITTVTTATIVRRRRNNPQIVRLSNFNYTIIRRMRINRNPNGVNTINGLIRNNNGLIRNNNGLLQNNNGLLQNNNRRANNGRVVGIIVG